MARGHEVSVLAPSSPHVELPGLRGVRRQGGADPVQRVGGAAAVRARHPPHGQKLAGRRRLRCAASARAQRAEPVDAGAEHRRGPDRRDVPHVDHEVVDAHACSSPSCGRCTRRSSAASRCRTWRGAGRWRRWAATPSRSPTASTSRRSRRRRCSTATRGRASRCCSSAASTSPARAWPCCWARCRRWSSGSPTSRS